MTFILLLLTLLLRLLYLLLLSLSLFSAFFVSSSSHGTGKAVPLQAWSGPEVPGS